MKLNFTPINLNSQTEYLSCFALCPQKASDYSFINLWAWAEEYGLCWAWAEDHVWIRQKNPFELLWAPVGPWANVSWEECFKKYIPSGTKFTRVPERLVKEWDESSNDNLVVEEARGHWDYLYSVNELIKLSGNRFHKKKNLFNQFKKKYAFRYEPLSAELIHRALEMQEDWCTWRDCESSEQLSAENHAVAKVLKSYDKLEGLMGGAIIVDHTMVAYTVAEKMSEDTLIIHFEKGSPEYKGVYQAINKMFLEHSGQNFAKVNREQDLDDEGLRKAKLSYNPVDFVKKYNVNLL